MQAVRRAGDERLQLAEGGLLLAVGQQAFDCLNRACERAFVLIEQQLRADISAMTRDGFLVIRNEYADGDGNGTINVPPVGQTNADCVFLYEGDEKQRLRRIDELMFFAKGKFASARTALDPQYLAESDAARIYYGHGQRGRVPTTPFNATDRYNQPELDGTLATTGQEYDSNARLGYDYPENPNKFASEWTLLRHVTLLSPPRTAQANPTPILGLTGHVGRGYMAQASAYGITCLSKPVQFDQLLTEINEALAAKRVL